MDLHLIEGEGDLKVLLGILFASTREEALFRKQQVFTQEELLAKIILDFRALPEQGKDDVFGHLTGAGILSVVELSFLKMRISGGIPPRSKMS